MKQKGVIGSVLIFPTVNTAHLPAERCWRRQAGPLHPADLLCPEQPPGISAQADPAPRWCGPGSLCSWCAPRLAAAPARPPGTPPGRSRRAESHP